MSASDIDVLIVGAGAAGLATAIFTRRRQPSRSVLLLDGAKSPGAKILVSGGGRCNVTNVSVSERDYWGGPSTIVRRVLRGLTVGETVRFFADAGVTLHEENDGKLFPDANRARQVLDALLSQAASSGVDLRSSHRVTRVEKLDDGFRVTTSSGVFAARHVVLATGGQSLPKSGSDGAGYAMARALGHTIVPTTPALAPLVLSSSDGQALHAEWSGVSQPVVLTLRADGSVTTRRPGSMLWTHFGISGPAALDLSRHWLRARLDGHAVETTANLAPPFTFESLDTHWLDQARERPRASLSTMLAALVPAAVADGVLRHLAIEPATPLSSLTRDDRRRLSHAITAWPIPVADSRGYNFAEATAGGVDLREIDPSTMESRCCRGLFLVGEILDVDGRLGGFNFQWAWASAAVAARGMAGAARGGR
jgi:predicted Rossmann fold flavoprotein